MGLNAWCQPQSRPQEVLAGRDRLGESLLSFVWPWEGSCERPEMTLPWQV